MLRQADFNALRKSVNRLHIALLHLIPVRFICILHNGPVTGKFEIAADEFHLEIVDFWLPFTADFPGHVYVGSLIPIICNVFMRLRADRDCIQML